MVMADMGYLAMHKLFCPYNGAPENFPDALVPEAHTEYRDFTFKSPDQFF